MDAESDVVVLDARGGIEVDCGLDANGVGEVDFAALKIVTGSGEQGASLGDGNAAQQRR